MSLADRRERRLALTRAFSEFEPGQRVAHPSRPEWGVGQVQSVVGDRVTVNFEHAGKVLVNTAVQTLSVIDDGEAGS